MRTKKNYTHSPRSFLLRKKFLYALVSYKKKSIFHKKGAFVCFATTARKNASHFCALATASQTHAILTKIKIILQKKAKAYKKPPIRSVCAGISSKKKDFRGLNWFSIRYIFVNASCV